MDTLGRRECHGTSQVGVRQGCVMSPWLFNVFMDGCMREMKCKVVNAGAKLRLNEEIWSVIHEEHCYGPLRG